MDIKIDTYPKDDTGRFVCLLHGEEGGQALKGKIRYAEQGDTHVDYMYVSVTDESAPVTTSAFVRDSNGSILMLHSGILLKFFWQMFQVTGRAAEECVDTYEDFVAWISDNGDPAHPDYSQVVYQDWVGPFAPRGPLNPRIAVAA